MSPLAAQEESFTLQEAVSLALGSSHILEQARAVTLERESGIEVARASTRPRLGL